MFHRRWRRVVVLGVVTLIFLGGAAWLVLTVPEAPRFPQPGEPLGDFAYPSLDGDTVRLSDQRGRVVLVNVWATWCPPCREEMPSMQRLYDLYRDSGFTVLAVSIDSDTAPVRPFVRELGLTFPILLDPRGTIQGLYGTAGVPETFVVDQDGRLILRRLGADDWFSERNQMSISTLLRGPVAPAR